MNIKNSGDRLLNSDIDNWNSRKQAYNPDHTQ